MSKMRSSNYSDAKEKIKVKRKGVHAKTKHSNNKGSKNYVKKYNGQGR